MNSTKQLTPGLHNRSHPRTGLLSGLLVLVSVAVITVHWPALSAKTLSFDDHQYLVENELVKNPSWSSAHRFLTEVLEPSTVQGYYQPLTMISLMLDHAAGGNTDYLVPFHRTSLVLHTANTALIIVLLYLLFGRPLPAVAAGILFGLHPMTVEPIPWIGERKTLLAAFFTLWCLIFYIRFTRKRNWKFYICCLGMYVLSLMSKPTSTPLPMLMLFLDYWPLKRLKRRCFIEKLPFFAIGFIFAMITYISQDRTIGTRLPTDYSLVRIPLILCHNIIFYPLKMIWPAKLSSHYAFPEPLSLSHPMVLTGVIGTFVLISLLIVSMRWTRAAMTGWLLFFTAIFPTMGIIGFTNVIASDKFAYLPSIGVLMVLTAFLSWLCKTRDAKFISRRTVTVIIVLILAVVEATATRRYLVHWQDTESYYKHMLTLTPRVASLHFNLAYELQSQNRLDEAADHYRHSLHTNPNDASSYNNLGAILQSQGKLEEAIRHYQNALQIEPDNVNSHTALGTVLSSQGKPVEAIGRFHQALEIKPDYAPAHYNLANTLVIQG
ncbi:MAG: tetratricopeptide repeat protein, partial [Planctomycetota bacterium]